MGSTAEGEIIVWFPTRVRDFYFLRGNQTSSGAHPTSNSVGNKGYFSWCKKAGTWWQITSTLGAMCCHDMHRDKLIPIFYLALMINWKSPGFLESVVARFGHTINKNVKYKQPTMYNTVWVSTNWLQHQLSVTVSDMVQALNSLLEMFLMVFAVLNLETVINYLDDVVVHKIWLYWHHTSRKHPQKPTLQRALCYLA